MNERGRTPELRNSSVRLPADLRADPRDGLAPVGVTGIGDGTNLNGVGRAGRQSGDRGRPFGIRDRLVDPGSRRSARTHRRAAYLIRPRIRTGQDRHQKLTAVLTRNDLSDPFRDGRYRRVRDGNGLEST